MATHTDTRGGDFFRLIVFIGILLRLDLCQRISFAFNLPDHVYEISLH
jgi:hypothetical protein